MNLFRAGVAAACLVAVVFVSTANAEYRTIELAVRGMD
jgi:hypothetical protein